MSLKIRSLLFCDRAASLPVECAWNAPGYGGWYCRGQTGAHAPHPLKLLADSCGWWNPEASGGSKSCHWLTAYLTAAAFALFDTRARLPDGEQQIGTQVWRGEKPAFGEKLCAGVAQKASRTPF